MQVTIGGNRVGSGKKMKAHINNYGRSTHNLSEEFITSAGAGILYPCLCKLAMRGDSFDIDLAADVRTIPTVGPLFGKFKLQIDVYQCPVRLYQGILHNNPLAIGMNMAQIKFPLLEIKTRQVKDAERNNGAFNDSALLKYLGMSGLGHAASNETTNDYGRRINALPTLSYYDIFKTYYANKQEENAYIISAAEVEKTIGTANIIELIAGSNSYNIESDDDTYHQLTSGENALYRIPVKYLTKTAILKNNEELIEIGFTDTNGDPIIESRVYTIGHLYNLQNTEDALIKKVIFEYNIDSKNEGNDLITIQTQSAPTNTTNITTYYTKVTAAIEQYDKLSIIPFKLSNIDDMRYDLLSHHELGTAFTIEDNENAYLPYSSLVAVDNNYETLNKYPMNGLCLKTYQNDIFNNWLNTDWIEGENGINEMSKVAIVNGAFSMDSLNFATKLYNMLNRIAVAGATYEDWQDVVYEEVARRQIESPIFCGGMSQIVAFDEIVQTAPTEIDGDKQALGTLGGRGRVLGDSKKGGKLHIKCDEACFIMAIVSLTPLISYTQGNEFYMTDVFSMDDMHKPAMDGIGFQDLIGERMAYFDTVITPSSTTVLHRSKIGKLPAWIEYMTSYNRAYGDMAATGGFGYMVLNRNYEQDSQGGIKDATTYIDPQKYNYVFAYDGLDAQNFWIKIKWDIIARRKMSARLIPSV